MRTSTACPYCRGHHTKKRKLSDGYFCADCRAAFRELLVEETETGAV